MKVLKFGTSSIATPEKFKTAAKLAGNMKNCIVILSAMNGITSLLEDISDYLYKKNPEGANDVINILDKDLSDKIVSFFNTEIIRLEARTIVRDKIDFIRSFTKDLFTLFEEKIVLAQGEIISSSFFTLALKESDKNVLEISALDFMKIDKKGEPDILYIKENLQQIFDHSIKADIYVTQGYICRNAYGEVDNFHFGGSDYTASLIGASINAKEIQIWTGFDTAKGKKSQLMFNPKSVHHIDFDEAAELAYFGAKILHPTCILPAKTGNIPVRLLSTELPDNKGTLISNLSETNMIKAIASKDGIICINIKSSRMLLAHGFLRKICEVFEKNQTSIDMLTTSEIGISMTIDNPKYLTEIVDDLKKLGIVTVENKTTLVSIIGDFGHPQHNMLTKVMEAISSLPLRMISYGGSSSSIAFIIKQDDKETVLKTLSKNIF